MPGTTVSPRGRLRSATAQPSVVSWSVSATTSRPARRAVSIRVAGSSVPSDTEEWACRSIRIAAQPAVRPTDSARRAAWDRLRIPPGAVLGRLRVTWDEIARLLVALLVAGRRGGAVAAEEQFADLAVARLRIRHVGQVAQGLVLTSRLEAEGAVAEHLAEQGLLPRE